MAGPYFYIAKATDKQFYFVLKSPNHETIATSEMYVSKQGAKDGIASVKLNAPIATVLDVTES